MPTIYLACQNDKPIPVGASEDEVKVAQAAQEWANYSKKCVSVLRVNGPFVDLHAYLFPENGE